MLIVDWGGLVQDGPDIHTPEGTDIPETLLFLPHFLFPFPGRAQGGFQVALGVPTRLGVGMNL